MKILHIASHDAILRGGAVQIVRMIKGQSMLGHSGSLVLNREKCEKLPQCIGDFVLICRKLNLKNLLLLLKLGKEHDISHVHKPDALKIGFFIKLILNKPVIFQRGTTYRLKGLSLLGLKLFSISVIAVSHAVKCGLLKSGLYEKRVHVVYGSSEYVELSKKKALLPSIGIVAALTGKKGYPLFFLTAKKLTSFISGLNFYVFGSGRKNKFESYYKDIKEHINFMGYVSDLKRIYNVIDILVCTSLKGEGFTGSVREAMLFGVPVATTPVSGNPEFVDGRKTGLLLSFEPDKSACILAKAIFTPKSLIKMRSNAQKKALKFFAVERQAERLIEIYKGAVR